MEADAPLDFALFQLSPRRQRCELVVSGNGRTEKIASGSVKPFVAHLRAAEEQASAQPPLPAIRLQLERRAPWFSKGTLERFVRFVSTPEVLELANTYDLEMSQLEGARRIYAQGVTGDATSGAAAENVTTSAAAAAADVTKKELLRAIDVRLNALKQDLAAACSRASSAGFNPNSVSELLLFANHFGANRLSEACTKFMSLCQRRPDISPQNALPAVSSHWKGFDDGNIRGSSSSDMSIDEPQVDLDQSNNKSIAGGSDSQTHRLNNGQGSVHVASEPVAEQQPKPTVQQAADKQETETETDVSPAPAVGVSRRLSVKDRISMFESQKKEQTPSSSNSTSAGTGRVVPAKGEHRRVPSGASMEKLVRRWSSVSDMSIDLSNNDSGNLNDKKENGTPVVTPTSTDLEANSKSRVEEALLKDKDILTSPSSEEHFRMVDKEIAGVAHEVPVASEQIPQNDIRGPRLHTKDIHTEAEVTGRKDRPSRTFEKTSGGVKSKASSHTRAHVRGSSGRDEVASTETEVHDASLQRNRLARKAEDVGRKVTVGSDSDCSGRQGTNLSRQSSITDQELNLQARGVDSFMVEEEPNSDYLSGDGSSRSADSRKNFSNKVASTQKASVASIHKRSSRTVGSGYANRRNPTENPLAQSVPNFSDLRKENTRPSPGLSRATTRAQQKSFARSKSIIEDSKSVLKEDQSRRSQSMRKSQIPDDLKDIPSANEDAYNWAPSRISNNRSEGAFAYNTRRTGPPKAFLRKGNGTHPVVGISGFQAAAAMMASALQRNESGDFEDQQEDSPDDAKEEEEYESIEENLRESDFPADSDSENPRVSHEFGNSDDPGSENGDVNFPSEVSGLGGTEFTAFTGNMHNPTGDLPVPWSSRLPQLFPYANDNSDGDAFADSPSGSPSPWNSHSLDEITDADVSRMRKKWGSAQMPFAGVNASQQPRKDVSKGLKKLWKFGRKNRGGDGLVNDWVSASTASECDDEMEDGRDLVVGSSDDFRKSRMGYLASYDGFVESEVFAEQGIWFLLFCKYSSRFL
nr:unnamed protein product [Digitaria exilis]